MRSTVPRGPSRLLRNARSFFAGLSKCDCHVPTDQGLEPVYDQGGLRDSAIPAPPPPYTRALTSVYSRPHLRIPAPPPPSYPRSPRVSRCGEHQAPSPPPPPLWRLPSATGHLRRCSAQERRRRARALCWARGDTRGERGYDGSILRGYDGSVLRGRDGSVLRGRDGSVLRGRDGFWSAGMAALSGGCGGVVRWARICWVGCASTP